MAAALDHAHGVGVYPQDIKPQNILIGQDERAKVIDFGLALIRPAWTGGEDPHGASGGTVAYMSPEQAATEAATARTDVFGLGGVLYFLITGHHLHPDSDCKEARARAEAGGPSRPRCSRRWAGSAWRLGRGSSGGSPRPRRSWPRGRT